MNGRKKRQATSTFSTTTTTSTTTTSTTTTSTTTTSTTTTSLYPSRCWIAAWSDKKLRTFEADVDTECFYYDIDSHISFRRNKLSTEEQANLQKKMEIYRKTSKAEQKDESNDDEIGAEKEAIKRSHNQRSHFCIDNLRNVSMS